MLPVVSDMRHLALNLVFVVLQLQRPGYKSRCEQYCASWPSAAC
jgi:hypothetical protein